MREIKFRLIDTKTAIRVDPKEFFITDSEVFIYYSDFDNSEKADMRHHVILQYTGLKDKNGAEIYEGDLLKWDGGRTGVSENPSEYVIEVLKSNHLDIELKEHTNPYMFHYDTAGYNFPGFLEKAEIIGNIYEDPELMEQE